MRLRLWGGGGRGSSQSALPLHPKVSIHPSWGREKSGGFSEATRPRVPWIHPQCEQCQESEPSWGLRGGERGLSGPDLRVWVAGRTQSVPGMVPPPSPLVPSPAPT